jgi:nitrogen regulatory protein PII
MNLIIAHLPNDAFEPVRIELLNLGVHRTTISQVHSSGPQPALTLQYRGAALDTHVRSELRLECLATAEQSPVVVDVLRGHASRTGAWAGRVAVLELQELHQASPLEEIDQASPEHHGVLDDAGLETAVS